MNQVERNKHTGKDYLKFIIPSILGIVLFMIPYSFYFPILPNVNFVAI